MLQIGLMNIAELQYTAKLPPPNSSELPPSHTCKEPGVPRNQLLTMMCSEQVHLGMTTLVASFWNSLLTDSNIEEQVEDYSFEDKLLAWLSPSSAITYR